MLLSFTEFPESTIKRFRLTWSCAVGEEIDQQRDVVHLLQMRANLIDASRKLGLHTRLRWGQGDFACHRYESLG